MPSLETELPNGSYRDMLAPPTPHHANYRPCNAHLRSHSLVCPLARDLTGYANKSRPKILHGKGDGQATPTPFGSRAIGGSPLIQHLAFSSSFESKRHGLSLDGGRDGLACQLMHPSLGLPQEVKLGRQDDDT